MRSAFSRFSVFSVFVCFFYCFSTLVFPTSPGPLLPPFGRPWDPPSRHLAFKSEAPAYIKQRFSKNPVFPAKYRLPQKSPKNLQKGGQKTSFFCSRELPVTSRCPIHFFPASRQVPKPPRDPPGGPFGSPGPDLASPGVDFGLPWGRFWDLEWIDLDLRPFDPSTLRP